MFWVIKFDLEEAVLFLVSKRLSETFYDLKTSVHRLLSHRSETEKHIRLEHEFSLRNRECKLMLTHFLNLMCSIHYKLKVTLICFKSTRA